ncbi:hypothetical protein [Brevibacterium siliguriense]|uniref:hypothetical protein n=1 Tax=Brevibacterium siliguriense TaxID=1136497 RepID=UPI0012FDBA47|nr:hypothetical protein [Brevibacterium siliguriense]
MSILPATGENEIVELSAASASSSNISDAAAASRMMGLSAADAAAGSATRAISLKRPVP